MNELQTLPTLLTLSDDIPAIYTATPGAGERFAEFFTVHIRNPHTRRAYAAAAREFAHWCGTHGIDSLAAVRPAHVAAYVEALLPTLSAPSVKQRLAALRMLFDWLVVGQVIGANPATAVRGPRHSVRKGKTRVLTASEARELLDAIDTGVPIGLRDRALIGLMVYSFSRVDAALKMAVEDVFVQGRRLWVRLHEKGGKEHEMPCHHKLETYLDDYLAALPAGTGNQPLFRTAEGASGRLTDRRMSQSDAYRMVHRRSVAAGIRTRIGNHSFRATGITEYLRNGGTLEKAQRMANHESSRTTGLYDRRHDEMSLDEVERILI